MENLILAGIDDLATEKQLSEGWSYFVIEKEFLKEFSRKAEKLLTNTKLNSFHGKNYKRRFRDNYLNFLKLCREYTEKSNISILSVILQDENWKNKFIPFTERVIKNVYGNNNINYPEIITSSQKLAAPLFTLQNLTKSFSSDYHIDVSIDCDQITESFDNLNIEISRPLGNIKMTSKKILSIIYNGYRKIQFPNSPILNKNGISVKPDENSYLIQAADIIGNFSLSYIMKKLGKKSITIDAKSEIFSIVFGDKFDDIDLSDVFEVTNSNEIKLKFTGQQVLKFGRY